MLKDLSPDLPGQLTSDADSKPITDPWELPSPVPKAKSSEVWKFPTEPHPLISAAGNPEALQLSAPKSNPVQVLLKDWLKLKAEDAKELAVELREALGLLYWMEGIA